VQPDLQVLVDSFVKQALWLARIIDDTIIYEKEAIK